ncbi:MAG: MotA/TolQ/ExbB proton channel family protein [Oligoflexales bacterium]|nr:MotA/TolQ/ExbB proton channel family protein [Oligoflexales bacterium]
MLSPFIGILILAGVAYASLHSRPSSQLGFFDPHAAFIVLGGVLGALLIAIDRTSLGRMLASLKEILPSTNTFTREMKAIHEGLNTIRSAWREGQKSRILEIADKSANKELMVAADALLKQMSPASLSEKFTELKTEYTRKYSPVIEGWEMVGKLGPSFGMVGTVTGMVQLFQNMNDNISNMGGSMALALLATLYGITIGAAIGGPMATRINTQLNDRLDLLEFLEKTTQALIEESKVLGSHKSGE